jgi:hypothetical protein
MYEPYDITTEKYMMILESIADHSENRVCARFVYLNRGMSHEGWSMNIEPSQVFFTIVNLKVRFEDQDDITKLYLSISRQGNVDDKSCLLEAGQRCAIDNDKQRAKMEPWVILYEWYTRQCLAVKIEGVKLRKASCVIDAKEIWLMDQEASISELAMNRVWKDMNKAIK